MRFRLNPRPHGLVSFLPLSFARPITIKKRLLSFLFLFSLFFLARPAYSPHKLQSFFSATLFSPSPIPSTKMFANSLSLITALLPLLALTTHAAAAHSNQPPHLRHKRVLHHRRDIEHRHPHVARAQLPPRSNAGHADAKKLIKKSVNKRGQTCRTRGSSYSTSSSYDVAAAQTVSSSSYAEPTSSSTAWSDDSSSSSYAAAATPVAATLSNEQAWAPQVRLGAPFL